MLRRFSSVCLAPSDSDSQAANLTAALSDPKSVLTAFLPTNAAFSELVSSLQTTPARLLAAKALVKEILLYHVVPQPLIFLSSLGQGAIRSGVKTLLPGETLTLRRAGGGVAVVAARSTAIVLEPDLPACKRCVLGGCGAEWKAFLTSSSVSSRVDIIDTVLIPSTPPPR